ncbi:hypothetical protein DH2020_041651 [Rehmannia glutinosa]|uniref:RNase H type-1 domain-containing protein n=1 Tax=Rehmannia glutinosa TaxID=99300 RepID=A0ABR0UPI8_REHGL
MPNSHATWKLVGLDGPILHFQQPSALLWARDFIQDSPSNMSEFSTVICNGIWYSRNKKFFDDHLPTPFAIVSSAGSLLSSYHAANGWPERPSSALSRMTASKKKKLTGTHIYFDGAISHSNKCAGIGLFIRKNDGSFLHGFSKGYPDILDPEVAEALALRDAILFATSLFLPDISFIGDSASIIAAANNLSTPSSACIPILADVELLLSAFAFYGLFWSPRTENIVAHEFAVYAKNYICTATSWQSPPEFLSQFVLDSFQQF